MKVTPSAVENAIVLVHQSYYFGFVSTNLPLLLLQTAEGEQVVL